MRATIECGMWTTIIVFALALALTAILIPLIGSRNHASQADAFVALNAVLFLVIIAACTLPLTGLAIHECLGASVLTLLTAHIISQWNRIAGSIRLLGNPAASWRQRVAIVVNALLFVTAVSVIYSGLSISQNLLPAFGVASHTTVTWILIHNISEHVLMVLLGLHLAVNWRWIIGTLRRGSSRR